MRGAAAPTSVEPRHRISLSNEETRRRWFQGSKNPSEHASKILSGPIRQRIFNYKILLLLKAVLIIILVGIILTIFHSPQLQNANHPSTSTHVSRLGSVEKYTRDSSEDPRYESNSDINWDQISNIIAKLSDKNEYQGIGLLNFNANEIDHWKKLIPGPQHVILHLESVSNNITWESLYPEWIDQDEEFEVPSCPSLPSLKVPKKPRIDLIAVKLPCKRTKKWSRDVARLHLQLAAARLAASAKGLFHPVRVLFVTDCFPIPNLFTCKDLVAREGNVWLYQPNLHKLRENVRLPVGSCELSVPLNAEEHFYYETLRREAYATILHSAHVYVCGAITAARSIRKAGSTRDLVILVDESISKHHRDGLEAAGWKIYTIQRIRNPKAEPKAYNEWNYSKFRLWQLTDYDKIIFIDADLLILRNIDFLFQMPEISATGNNATLFNSGVMVVEPSSCTFQLLMDNINEIESYNGGDQGYLNEIFTWWHRIPKQMNFLKHFWEGDGEEKKKSKIRLFGADPPILYVLHYLGNKPWLCFRDYDCNWNVDFLHEFASDVAHKTWWKVHDTMPKKLQEFCLLRTKQKAALEWDRREAEKANYSDGHWRIKVRDKRLKICFEKFCSWKMMLRHWGEKHLTNNSTARPSASGPPSGTTTKALL